MNKTYIKIISVIISVGMVGLPLSGNAADDEQITALKQRVATLAHEIQLLEDHDAIEILQRTYGFYMDKALWTHVSDLFTDDGSMEIGTSGVFVSKARIKEYLFSLGQEGPQEGRLIEQTQLQPLIHVSPDGQSAKGRWHSLVMAGQHKAQAYWGTVIYENEYRKQDGIWRISRLVAYNIMFSDYAEGWGKHAVAGIWPEQTLEPDLPSSTAHSSYPKKHLTPFHYENPVTGNPVTFASTGTAKTTVSSDNLEQTLTDLDGRLQRLNDVHNIERLQNVYGYYLDKLEWDNLAELFVEDGSIEIAQRGIYVSKKRVRDNLNLYGEQGVHHGTLHNHIQLQPVIHVAADGKVAHARARALSMLGTYGRVGVWGASVYENEYVKQNGVWRFKKDHLYTTMFTTYDEGWAVAPRGAPGINESNPPDLPPSEVYQAFPKTHIPPFHYPHPVTGVEITVPVSSVQE